MKSMIFLLSCLSFTALSGANDTFSPSRLIHFGNTVIAEQKETLTPTNPNAPVYKPGYVLMQIANNSGQPDSNVYLVVKGVNGSSQDCYLAIGLGIGAYVPVGTTTLSTTYSYPLSSLPGTTGQRFFYVPNPFTSARAYFSVNYPLLLQIQPDATTGILTIDDPSSFSLSDPNYYTLYDKFEFTYDLPTPAPGANLFVNPTAVDFFSLPINLQMNNSVGSITNSGLTSSRNTILTGSQTTFTTYDMTSANVWNNLFLPFYVDPYAGSPSLITYLRLASPATATAPGSTTVNPDQAFPNDYLSNAATYGFDYINDGTPNSVWGFYSVPGNQLNIDTTELAGIFGPGVDSPLYPDYYYLTGTINGSNQFFFTNNLPAPNTYTWFMNEPNTAYPFFSGGNFDDAGEANGTPGAVIVRQITSAFDVGLLPNTFASGTFMNQTYFLNNMASYYTSNPNWGPVAAVNGPFYDLYSKALHGFGDLIYTFAYDDELGQDGTLTGNVEALQSSLSVVLGTVDTPIPDPFDDPLLYTVTFQYAVTNPVQYRNGTNGAWIAPANGSTVSNIASTSSNPFQLMLMDATGTQQILTVFLKYNVVIPQVPNFELSSGVVITHTAPTPETYVTIQTPSM